MDMKKYTMKWLLIVGLLKRALTSSRGWVILLFAAVVMGGCEREVIVIDNTEDTPAIDTTPAQFVEMNHSESGRILEVYFDKPPINLRVYGAKHYTLLDTKVKIITTKCDSKVVVAWHGGQRTFADRCAPPPPATGVGIIPRPGSTVPPNQQFSVGFNMGVVAVIVNGVAARGAHMEWIVTPGLKEGVVRLTIEWTNRDGSTGSQVVGPYIVRDE